MNKHSLTGPWLAGFLLGCSPQLGDTEGRTYELDCAQRPCTLVPVQDDSPPGKALPKESRLSLNADGRMLLACPAPAASSDPRNCRALTCDSSSACSQAGGADFSCQRRLCQAATRALTSSDRQALCLAGTGTWNGSRDQRSRSALAESCRPPCTVPGRCLQPD